MIPQTCLPDADADEEGCECSGQATQDQKAVDGLLFVGGGAELVVGTPDIHPGIVTINRRTKGTLNYDKSL